ncbi:MAG: beta-ketoacyl-[acyl-carrier-protein] synthase family protein [Bacteroidetes bacterium]|nr:beta-ketoacyl-[acyl-carrier-protein] synthase family protein [Bacteroidota bacterium]HET6244624.1 beta-ketoacyl-[acyl-carrier-protein] synthase family protein [Bacteroidia bacterium]
MNKRIYVAGAGIISAIGNDIEQTLLSFEKHQSGVSSAMHLTTRHKSEFPLAEVKMSNQELGELTGLNENLSRTVLLSYYAAKQAVSPFLTDVLKKFKIGFISASSVGGMDKTEFFFQDFLKDNNTGNLRDVMLHDCGKHTDFVAEKLGINDFVTTISTACSSSANAIMLAGRLIKSGQLDIVVAGGVDALTRFTLNGFNSLMIVDREQCRPLDQTRAGLNLGEGAAYLVLMSEKAAEAFSASPLCELTGYCNTNDSFHQTALSDEGNGPYLAMMGALKMSNLKTSEISYINMHGTGTQNNDNAEGKAVERVFHPDYPKLSSTKSFTGHTLGASGAVEAVFAALAISKGLVFPNFNFKETIQDLHIKPETSFQKNLEINHVLSNSFGFGGNCTSLIFSKA